MLVTYSTRVDCKNKKLRLEGLAHVRHLTSTQSAAQKNDVNDSGNIIK